MNIVLYCIVELLRIVVSCKTFNSSMKFKFIHIHRSREVSCTIKSKPVQTRAGHNTFWGGIRPSGRGLCFPSIETYGYDYTGDDDRAGDNKDNNDDDVLSAYWIF